MACFGEFSGDASGCRVFHARAAQNTMAARDDDGMRNHLLNADWTRISGKAGSKCGFGVRRNGGGHCCVCAHEVRHAVVCNDRASPGAQCQSEAREDSDGAELAEGSFRSDGGFRGIPSDRTCHAGGVAAVRQHVFQREAEEDRRGVVGLEEAAAHGARGAQDRPWL